MAGYNYDAFSPDNYNLASADGPVVEDKAPNFDLETHDGQACRLLDIERECRRSYSLSTSSSKLLTMYSGRFPQSGAAQGTWRCVRSRCETILPDSW